MSELAKFHDRQAMQRASERFVRALVGAPVEVENVAEPRLTCGHDLAQAFRYGGELRCARCRDAEARRSKADYEREMRLPEMIEATRLKLIHLEREAKRRGQIV